MTTTRFRYDTVTTATGAETFVTAAGVSQGVRGAAELREVAQLVRAANAHRLSQHWTGFVEVALRDHHERLGRFRARA